MVSLWLGDATMRRGRASAVLLGVAAASLGAGLVLVSTSDAPRLFVAPLASADVSRGLEFVGAPPAYLVSVPNMAPGETVLAQIALRALHATPVTLSQKQVTSTPATPPLADELQLKVVDTATSATVYSGPVGGMPSPLAVCGTTSGECSDWLEGEVHTVTFGVTLPMAADNRYQGASASWVVAFDATAPGGAVNGSTTGPSVPGTGADIARRWMGALLVGFGSMLVIGSRLLLPRRRRPGSPAALPRP